VAALRVLVEEGFEPKGTLEVAFVPDEESGGVGTRYLVEKGLAKPDYVVIAEPTTTGSIVVGHKGLARGVVRVYGKQVHGSVPWMGENAFLKAAALALEFSRMYEPVLASRRTQAPVKYPEGAHPTINLGGFAESTSRKDNTVPGEFVFSFDRRIIPEEDPKAVAEELRRFFAEAAERVGVRHEVEIRSLVPPSLTPLDSELVSAARACVGEELGAQPEVYMTMGRNDAVYYVRMVGSHAINYGPGVEFTAHTANEYTTIEEISRSIRVYTCLVKRLLSR
ncbi:MAG: M20/M25/M40 family metallo-hydrolase, partial [Thermoproteota archaeon]